MDFALHFDMTTLNAIIVLVNERVGNANCAFQYPYGNGEIETHSLPHFRSYFGQFRIGSNKSDHHSHRFFMLSSARRQDLLHAPHDSGGQTNFDSP